MPFVVTCMQCQQEVLQGDRLRKDEECLLRDRLLAAHPTTIQPETLSVLLPLFDVTEEPPPAA